MAEERLTDDPVKKQRPEDGIFEVDGEEYDDDLVGLTPGKLEEELERRRLAEARARAERERLAAEAETKLAEGDFEGAASLYLKAAEQGYEGAETGFWRAKTKNYTDLACFYDRRTARAFARAGEEAREDVLAHMGSEIEAEEARCEEIAAPLREKVYAGMASRRSAFRANRNYYLLRFAAAFGIFLLFAVGCAVAASFIVRTRDLTAPVLTAVFGGLALAGLAVSLVFSRKLFVAQKLVSDNEKLSSTEDGAVLAESEERLALLKSVREGEEEQEYTTDEDFSEYNALADDEDSPADMDSPGGADDPVEDGPEHPEA